MRPRLHIAHKQVDYPYSADDTAEHIEPKNVLDVAAQRGPGAEDRDVGFAIAHGHPISATGAVLTTRLLHSIRRDGTERGVVTLCLGGGQGIALAFSQSIDASNSGLSNRPGMKQTKAKFRRPRRSK